VYLAPVPDATTLLRWAHLVGPAPLAALNERVVQLARSLRVTRGRKLRVDSAVVETTIHHPTDSRLVGDGVRVLSRLLRRAKAVLGAAGQGAGLGPAAFRSRTRSVRRLAQTLHRVARRKGEAAAEQLRTAYRHLLAVATASRAQADRVRAALRAQGDAPSRRLAERFERVLPLVAQALAQAQRRVLEGQPVPAPEKLLSLFEPHTQVIVRHKPGKPAEFGRKLWLEEVEGGLVSGYRVLPAAGPDDAYLAESLAAHRRRFGRPPWLVAGDRGVASPRNERLATEAGVQRIVLPTRGRASPARARHERQPWFRRGFRFRAGIEGRISVLRRRFGLARCPDHGEVGMGRWVGWGILAHNLTKLAQTQAARAARAA
jgi:IS5 family transposase